MPVDRGGLARLQSRKDNAAGREIVGGAPAVVAHRDFTGAGGDDHRAAAQFQQIFPRHVVHQQLVRQLLPQRRILDGRPLQGGNFDNQADGAAGAVAPRNRFAGARRVAVGEPRDVGRLVQEAFVERPVGNWHREIAGNLPRQHDVVGAGVAREVGVDVQAAHQRHVVLRLTLAPGAGTTVGARRGAGAAGVAGAVGAPHPGVVAVQVDAVPVVAAVLQVAVGIHDRRHHQPLARQVGGVGRRPLEHVLQEQERRFGGHAFIAVVRAVDVEGRQRRQLRLGERGNVQRDVDRKDGEPERPGAAAVLAVDCQFRVLRRQRLGVVAQLVVAVQPLERLGLRRERQQRQPEQRCQQQESHTPPACAGD